MSPTPTSIKIMDIHALVEEKINSDADFQASLEEMSDEDKETAISEKRSELIKAEADALEQAKIKAEEIAKNQKIRAEKAEQEAKKNKPVEGEEPPKKDESGVSLKDVRALQNVHDDDVDFVVNWAKANNMEIAEAIKSKDVQYVLEGHKEERKTADTTSVESGGKRPSKASAEDLLSKAQQGDLPDDDEGINAVIAAKNESLRQKK